MPALFDEVAIYFSDEEWDVLTEPQRALYREVMRMNYDTVLSLGEARAPAAPGSPEPRRHPAPLAPLPSQPPSPSSCALHVSWVRAWQGQGRGALASSMWGSPNRPQSHRHSHQDQEDVAQGASPWAWACPSHVP